MTVPSPEHLLAAPERAMLTLLSSAVSLSISTISGVLCEGRLPSALSCAHALLPALHELELRLAEYHHHARLESEEPLEPELPF